MLYRRLLVGAALSLGACAEVGEAIHKSLDPYGISDKCTVQKDPEACFAVRRGMAVFGQDDSTRFIYAGLKIAGGTKPSCDPGNCPHVQLGPCLVSNGITYMYHKLPNGMYDKFCLANCLNCNTTLAKDKHAVPPAEVPWDWRY